MTIYQRLAEIFRAADIPGFLNYWRKSTEYPEVPAIFCTYVVTQERDALCADDIELIHQYNITIRMYGKGDLTAAHERLRLTLLANCFPTVRQSDLADIYSGEWRYCKRIDALYIEEV